MSEITEKYVKISHILFFIGFFLTFLPAIIFGVAGCLNGSIKTENKVTFGAISFVAFMLTILGIKVKFNCRAITYILIFAAYFVVKRVEIVVLVSGICAMLDDFVIRPLHKYYRDKAKINKEIDKRIPVDTGE